MTEHRQEENERGQEDPRIAVALGLLGNLRMELGHGHASKPSLTRGDIDFTLSVVAGVLRQPSAGASAESDDEHEHMPREVSRAAGAAEVVFACEVPFCDWTGIVRPSGGAP